MKIYPVSPVVGVGVIVFKDGLVLLEKRRNEPGRGKWNLPGGTLKLGEKIFGCTEREIMEECGIRIKPIDIVKVYEIIEREEEKVKFHYVIVDVVSEYVSGEIKAGSDALDLMWVKWNEVGKFSVPERVKEAILKGREIFEKEKEGSYR